MKKQMKIIVPLAVLILIVGLIIGIIIYKINAPSKEHMSLTKYFDKSDGQVVLILGNEISDSTGIYQDNQLYLDYNLVKEKLNNKFYWDANENLLLYTLPNAIVSAEPEMKQYNENNSQNAVDYEPVKISENQVYVAIDYVKEFTALDYKFEKKPTRAIITYQYSGEKIKCKKTNDECALRFKADKKSDILVDLKKNEQLFLIQKEDKETGYCKVMEPSGVVGYVKADDLGKTYDIQNTTTFKTPKYPHITKDKKINLVWHQVTNQTANSKLISLLDNTKGVTVVSPTWFKTSDNDGEIESLASDTYVAQAHRAGVEVWALCDDFSPNMKIGKVLAYTSKRQKLAKNLVAEAIRYSLDGINIDFENVKKESGEDFVQFVRELSVLCRNNGIVLSVDNYPPKNYNSYYNRQEQAKMADYIVTMAYDEYYSGSEKAGPVASLGYVKDAIEKLNKEENIPNSQSIIALPFYSRHWMEKTSNGKVKLSSEACSMKYVQELIEDSGEKTTWDDQASMNFISYNKNNTLHKIWVEDSTSLELKLKETKNADVAGVAFWKLGLEDSSIWDTVLKYLK